MGEDDGLKTREFVQRWLSNLGSFEDNEHMFKF